LPDGRLPCVGPLKGNVQASSGETAIERRRPGRIEDVSPEPVELLRNPATVEIQDVAQADLIRTDPKRDDLGVARGLVVALAIPLWCLIGLAVWGAVK
jgi:hypothetical protein